MAGYPGANVNVGITVPVTVASGSTYDSGLLVSRGQSLSVWVKATQALTLNILQYADATGLVPIGAAITQAVSANTLTNKTTPAPSIATYFTTFRIQLVNASGSAANINNLVVVQ